MLRKTSVTAAALGISLFLTNAYGVTAASNSNKATVKKVTQSTTKQSKSAVHTLANLKPIKITANSTVRLTDVNIFTLDEESILTYTLTITNGDGKPLDLMDYWSKVKTASGSTYSTTLMTKDKEKKKLSAGSSTTLTYVAKVGKNVKPSSLVFQVIKWDFSQSNYESMKGQIKIPATYLTSTPASQSKTLRVFDTPIKAKITQAAAFVSGDYNYVNVALNIQNVGYKILEDPKVKYVIKTANGASYPMSADPSSIDYKIQPQDSKSLNLMTSIPKSISLKGMELQLVQDDETAKMSLPIATMQMPNIANKSLAIAANAEKLIPVGNGKISASVSGTSMVQSYDEHSISIRFLLKNTSGTIVKLPKYQFEVQTNDGYRLPIDTKTLENITLQPLEERNLTLHASVPANVNVDKLQLFMNIPPAEDSKEGFSYPVGIFALPEATPAQNSVGQSQFVQTKNGILGFKLSTIQRLPWSDGDLVSAKITISNTGYKTILLPDLAGELKIDSAKLTTDTKLIKTQSAGLLGAGMSTDVYVVAKIPNYLNFTQLQISLLEKIGENTSEWMQFSSMGSLPELATVTKGDTYTLGTNGRQEELRVMRSFVYAGASSDLLYTELEVKNTEKHQIDLSQFAGSYEGANGQTYRTSVSQIDTSVGPEEKSMVALWSKIPKSAQVSAIKLIVGEGIKENSLTPVKGESDGYVNAIALELGVVQPSVKGNLANLELFPYTLTVKNVRANLTGSTSVNLVFDYNQTRNMDYSIGEFNHKYLFEVVDSSGRTFEKEFSPETDLRLTNGASTSFSFDDATFEDRLAGSFQLNVYDLFQGQKVKIGSQSFSYISPTDNDNKKH